MFIQKVLTQYNNDFTATMECEHCGSTEHLGYGYNDEFFHSKVIPAIMCNICGKSSNDVEIDVDILGEK
jgi:C4-type Zn-finger protein